MPSEREAELEKLREARALYWQGGITSARTSEDPRTISVAVASTSVLPENLERKGLSVVNDSAATIYLGLGKAAVLHNDIVLLPGGSWNGRLSEILWLGEVNAIATVAASSLCVVEV